MIIANLFANSFPNMFLRVQIWTGGWKENNLQTRMLLQQLINWFARMPGSPIPKQNNRYLRIRFQDISKYCADISALIKSERMATSCPLCKFKVA